MADPIERPGRSRSGPTRLVAAVTAVAAAVALTASSCVLDGAWAATAPAAAGPPGVGASFIDVSCPTEDFCMALGLVEIPLVTVPDPPGTYVYTFSPIVQIWDGSVWTQIPFETVTPFPDLHGVVPNDVDCGTPTSCAIQWDMSFDDERIQLWSVWDGESFIAPTVPFEPTSIEAQVACSTDGSCVFAADSSPTMVWDGITFESFTADEGVLTPDMTALTCSSASSCIGVTALGTSSRWNGSSWSSKFTGPPLPIPSIGATRWASIDCSAPTTCTAVGTTDDPAPAAPDLPAAAAFDGTAWTATPLPIAAGRLAAVSCASTIACVAIGSEATGSPATYQSVALAWNGGQWYRAPAPPLPAGAAYTDIGCSIGDRCMAVGSATTGGVASPLASTYAWEPTS